VSGIDIVGPLPPEIQAVTVFSAGLSKNAKNVEGANALIHFLSTPRAAAVMKAKGMEVG
jgi:molybdate transport system substrate-binding protein